MCIINRSSSLLFFCLFCFITLFSFYSWVKKIHTERHSQYAVSINLLLSVNYSFHLIINYQHTQISLFFFLSSSLSLLSSSHHHHFLAHFNTNVSYTMNFFLITSIYFVANEFVSIWINFFLTAFSIFFSSHIRDLQLDMHHVKLKMISLFNSFKLIACVWMKWNEMREK